MKEDADLKIIIVDDGSTNSTIEDEYLNVYVAETVYRNKGQ